MSEQSNAREQATHDLSQAWGKLNKVGVFSVYRGDGGLELQMREDAFKAAFAEYQTDLDYAINHPDTVVRKDFMIYKMVGDVKCFALVKRKNNQQAAE